MTCPHCHATRDRVINSGLSDDGKERIRRHQCLTCHHRWPTRELDAARLQSPLPATARRVSGHRPHKKRA